MIFEGFEDLPRSEGTEEEKLKLFRRIRMDLTIFFVDYNIIYLNEQKEIKPMKMFLKIFGPRPTSYNSVFAVYFVQMASALRKPASRYTQSAWSCIKI